MIIFLVYRPGFTIENIIVSAKDREDAKRQCQPILKGNPDQYIVDPITKRGTKTVILLGGG